jgi:hypothetical protein
VKFLMIHCINEAVSSPTGGTKEQIAGFDVIDCASMEEAVKIASRHPTARIGTFELRPFWE